MMRKSAYFILSIILIFYAMEVFSEEDGNKDYVLSKEGLKIPVGMEIKKVGDANILVPQGGKIRKVGDLLVRESIDEYAAREFMMMRERLNHIEKEQDIIKKEIEELKKITSD